MGIIPTKDADFNNYINRVIPYLVTHRVRLGVSDPNRVQLSAWLTDWNAVYPKSQDPDLRTTAITDQKNNLREDIEDLLRAVYGDIPESALTESDRAKLNLKARDEEPTAPAAITTAPTVDLKAESGARIELVLRVEHDDSRASRHPDADSIELRYKIGGEAPNSWEDTDQKEIFTTAMHTLQLSGTDIGKRFWCYARWHNLRNKSKSGPWSQVSTSVITD